MELDIFPREDFLPWSSWSTMSQFGIWEFEGKETSGHLFAASRLRPKARCCGTFGLSPIAKRLPLDSGRLLRNGKSFFEFSF